MCGDVPVCDHEVALCEGEGGEREGAGREEMRETTFQGPSADVYVFVCMCVEGGGVEGGS